MKIGTPLGLAFVSGINAYLPLLLFAVCVRWLHLYSLNPNFSFIVSDWFISVLVALTIADFVADKFPVIDHTWDGIHTVVRPISGALVAAASSNQLFIPTSSDVTSNQMLGIGAPAAINLNMQGIGIVLIAIIGGLLAATTHTAKSSTRLLSTVTTAGFLNIALSIIEDVFVVIATLLSLFVPAVMLLLIVVSLVIVGPRLYRLWSGRLHRH
ncbi:MAG: DUF4126 domain-containing protein [Ktedonobacteraceae bacterium]